MNADELTHSFSRDGYIIVPEVIDRDEIASLRGMLDSQMRGMDEGKPTPTRMLQTRQVLREPRLYRLSLLRKVNKALEAILGENFVLIPDFQVQRNMFGFPGWHVDSGGEGRAPYLRRHDYHFVKCGIFLQDNTLAYGGGGSTWCPKAKNSPCDPAATGWTSASSNWRIA